MKIVWFAWKWTSLLIKHISGATVSHKDPFWQRSKEELRKEKNVIKTNLEGKNPNKPPKEDGMTDTPLKMKKKKI